MFHPHLLFQSEGSDKGKKTHSNLFLKFPTEIKCGLILSNRSFDDIFDAWRYLQLNSVSKITVHKKSVEDPIQLY